MGMSPEEEKEYKNSMAINMAQSIIESVKTSQKCPYCEDGTGLDKNHNFGCAYLTAELYLNEFDEGKLITMTPLDMKKVLQEIYRNAMDYGTPYYTIDEFQKAFGKVQWNKGALDGFYVTDEGLIQVR